MSKQFFRFLRGELNGYYITRLNNVMNVMAKDIRDFFVSFKTMQFNNDMDEDIISGIGKFASVFLPWYSTEEQTSSLTFSESRIVDGVEYSERGLYNTEDERFEYKHTTQETGLPDINTLATPTLRSSLVGNESVTGYIASSEEDVLDENGNVKESAILSEPPSGQAYSEFYSNDFLFLSEGETKTHYKQLSKAFYLDIYRTLQWIRYNGISLDSLLHITSILCPEGLVKIDSIELAQDNIHFIITYRVDTESTVTFKRQRIFLLEYIIGMKFKQFVTSAE